MLKKFTEKIHSWWKFDEAIIVHSFFEDTVYKLAFATLSVVKWSRLEGVASLLSIVESILLTSSY